MIFSGAGGVARDGARIVPIRSGWTGRDTLGNSHAVVSGGVLRVGTTRGPGKGGTAGTEAKAAAQHRRKGAAIFPWAYHAFQSVQVWSLEAWRKEPQSLLAA